MNNRDEEHLSRLEIWVVERWPRGLILVGLILFWAACLASDKLPLDVLFFGPALMLGGIILEASNRRR